MKIPRLSDPALSETCCHNLPASTGGVPCASHASRTSTGKRTHNKKTTGYLSNESFWSSAGLKSNGAKRVVQSGELSWVEEHVVQYKCSCMRKQGEEMSPVFAKELELPVKKHCSRGRESNSFLPRYRRISACYLEQLKTNKNTPPHLKKNPKPTPPNKKPNNYSDLSLSRTAQQRETQSGNYRLVSPLAIQR